MQCISLYHLQAVEEYFVCLFVCFCSIFEYSGKFMEVSLGVFYEVLLFISQYPITKTMCPNCTRETLH